MHLCHNSKENLWGESEWWVCNHNRYLSDCAGVCGGKRTRGTESEKNPNKCSKYTTQEQPGVRIWQEMKSIKRSDTRKVEITWPGETGGGEGLTRSRQSQTAYRTGRQLHRLTGSFMSQIRCALGSTRAWGAISWDRLGVTCAFLLKFRRRNTLNTCEQSSGRCVKMEF